MLNQQVEVPNPVVPFEQANHQLLEMEIDPQTQDNPAPELQIMGHNHHNRNHNINLGLATLGFTNDEMDPGLKDFLGGIMQKGQPKPDLYRLWAKYFSPVGCPDNVIQIPKD